MEDRFGSRCGVLRKQRHHQNITDASSLELSHRVPNEGLAVAHAVKHQHVLTRFVIGLLHTLEQAVGVDL